MQRDEDELKGTRTPVSGVQLDENALQGTRSPVSLVQLDEDELEATESPVPIVQLNEDEDELEGTESPVPVMQLDEDELEVAPISVDRNTGKMATGKEDKVVRKPRVFRSSTIAMSMFLRHFTVVGDDYNTWNINYKKWENEEEEEGEEGEHSSAAAPVSAEEGRAEDLPVAASVAVRPRPRLSFREKLRKLFSSHRFQVVIICLVILDALLVLAELILDLKIIKVNKHNTANQVFHYMSIAILTFFIMEITFKIYAFRMEFFQHKFEILDSIVVVVSFVIDITLVFWEHEFEALNLLILLRLWRVARIINGIIISVKTRSERQVLRLKQLNKQLVSKIQQLEFSCSEKEQEIERLYKLLKQHGLIEDMN